ncbi:hypothetical protein SAMN05216569_0427 [Pseudoxanthomonas sp. CF125]|nr:hypothetical protein SAMN05216569_0427 [Pseudoxanthomonas sp. CF125]
MTLFMQVRPKFVNFVPAISGTFVLSQDKTRIRGPRLFSCYASCDYQITRTLMNKVRGGVYWVPYRLTLACGL